VEFGADWSQVEVVTGTDWLVMEEKTGEDQLMVLEESEVQIPQQLMAGRVIWWQQAVDWDNYLPHSELLLQMTESHPDQMVTRKPL